MRDYPIAPNRFIQLVQLVVNWGGAWIKTWPLPNVLTINGSSYAWRWTDFKTKADSQYLGSFVTGDSSILRDSRPRPMVEAVGMLRKHSKSIYWWSKLNWEDGIIKQTLTSNKLTLALRKRWRSKSAVCPSYTPYKVGVYNTSWLCTQCVDVHFMRIN